MTARDSERSAGPARYGTAAAPPSPADLPVMVIALDAAGRFVAWNERCGRVLGYETREVLAGEEVFERLFPDPEYRLRVRQQCLADPHGEASWQWEMTCKDGTLRTVIWSPGPADQAPPGWHVWAVGVDITPQTQATAELRIRREWLNAAFEHNLDGINVV